MPTPTNLLTGFLGVGKTTAILHLLAHKPAGERWAVLVNEFGEVGIDAAILEGASPDGVAVREVAGGCFCCATAPYLPVALHFLLNDTKPDRLLIESSGLGHPAALIDTLRANYAGRLEVRATLGLVDPNDFAQPAMQKNRVFVDQMTLADVLVLNKLDTAAPELVANFQAWANALHPPKLLVVGTTHGQLDPAWLDLSARDELPPTATHEAHSPYESNGWVFGPDVAFDEAKLLAVLGRPEFVRLKGVFRVEDDWISINRAGGTLTVAPTAYRRDSRLEVFARPGANWLALATELQACRRRSPAAP